MVSTRPSPSPSRGRIAYPTADTYTPGDSTTAPTSTSPPASSPPPISAPIPILQNSHPIQSVSSHESDPGAGAGAGSADKEKKSWWNLGSSPREDTIQEQAVFGVPLAESIKYASVQISTPDQDGKLYVWGVIPIVMAKCGSYLKDEATEVEGAFRISGSAKRMRELQTVFDTGPRYGKGLDWTATDFSPHDVATIFRRFLTQAPESVIPAEFYEDFRAVMEAETPVEEAIEQYKELIRSIPAVNQYLLLYVLDLLSVFARKADKNLMTAPNLALIFQPGILSHPVHLMRPREHVLSQQVLEFLIEHQDHFLIGMQLKSKKTRGAKRAAAPPAADPGPPLVKADPDLIPPSESDDEPPAGGYYVIEGNPRSPAPGQGQPIVQTIDPASLAPPPPTPSKSLKSIKTKSRSGSNATATAPGRARSPSSPMSPTSPSIPIPVPMSSPGPMPLTSPNLEALNASSASASASASALQPAGLGIATGPTAAGSGAGAQSPPLARPRAPVVREQMAASDSDDEAPEGGYFVRVSDKALEREALAKNQPQQSRGIRLGRSGSLVSKKGIAGIASRLKVGGGGAKEA